MNARTLHFTGCKTKKQAAARFVEWLDTISADHLREMHTGLLLDGVDPDDIDDALAMASDVSTAALSRAGERFAEVIDGLAVAEWPRH